MPEPVIPHDMYHDFRSPLAKQPVNHDEVVSTYKKLIQRMPRANQYLLLYVLDLLSVFARKSDKNLMTATNLAVIFRPGLISHPNHEMSPGEHSLSQQVLEFLIAQQDWFLLDIPPPPRSEPGSWKGKPPRPIADEEHDLMVAPSSDEDHSGISGGWKLVGRERRITRRRTTLERAESADKITRIPEVKLSPVVEAPVPSRRDSAGGASVSRSRTLPSRRDVAGGSVTDDEKHRARVLRKQKRVSAHPKHADAPTSMAG